MNQQSDMFNKKEVLLRSLVKILFSLVIVALVGFTLVVNEKNFAEPSATNEIASVEEEAVTADRSLVEFVR